MSLRQGVRGRIELDRNRGIPRRHAKRFSGGVLVIRVPEQDDRGQDDSSSTAYVFRIKLLP